MYRLVYQGTIEAKVYDRILAKESLFSSVVDKKQLKALIGGWRAAVHGGQCVRVPGARASPGPGLARGQGYQQRR